MEDAGLWMGTAVLARGFRWLGGNQPGQVTSPEAASCQQARAARQNENEAQRASDPNGDQEQATSGLILRRASCCGVVSGLVFCLERPGSKTASWSTLPCWRERPGPVALGCQPASSSLISHTCTAWVWPPLPSSPETKDFTAPSPQSVFLPSPHWSSRMRFTADYTLPVSALHRSLWPLCITSPPPLKGPISTSALKTDTAQVHCVPEAVPGSPTHSPTPPPINRYL